MALVSRHVADALAAHIRAPKILVQGRYDEDTPLRTAAEPLFRLMPEPKRLVLFEGGHMPPVELTSVGCR